MHDTGIRCITSPCPSFVPRCEPVACPKIACAPCAPPLKTVETKDANGCLVGCKCVRAMPCDVSIPIVTIKRGSQHYPQCT